MSYDEFVLLIFSLISLTVGIVLLVMSIRLRDKLKLCTNENVRKSHTGLITMSAILIALPIVSYSVSKYLSKYTNRASGSKDGKVVTMCLGILLVVGIVLVVLASIIYNDSNTKGCKKVRKSLVELPVIIAMGIFLIGFVVFMYNRYIRRRFVNTGPSHIALQGYDPLENSRLLDTPPQPINPPPPRAPPRPGSKFCGSTHRD